jgi:hypothetical protein
LKASVSNWDKEPVPASHRDKIVIALQFYLYLHVIIENIGDEIPVYEEKIQEIETLFA